MNNQHNEAEAKRHDEARFALGVSIPGAIKGAGDLDKLGSEELRVVVQIIKGLCEYVKYQLNEIDSGLAREEDANGNSDEIG